MDTRQVVVNGTVQPDGTLDLDEKVRLPAGRVQVTVQWEAQPGPEVVSLRETFEQINKSQEARGFQGRSKEEIDASVRELREEPEYDAKWKQIYRQTQFPIPEEGQP